MTKGLRFCFLCTLLLIYSTISYAQFLKKIKDKINNTVDKTINGKNTDNTAAKGNANTGTSTTIDFAKYSITAIHTFSNAAIKEKMYDVEYSYCSYYIKDTAIVAKVVVYAADNINEAGGYEGNTAAYVFEAGQPVKTTAIKTIESQKGNFRTEYKRWDWPYSGWDLASGIADTTHYILTSGIGSLPKAFIKINGKQYGPYFTVNNLVVDKFRTKFYAIIGEQGNDDVVYYFISSGGKKVKIPSPATGIMLNNAFSNAAVFGFTGKLQAQEDKGTDVVTAINNTLNSSDIYFIDGSVVKNANTSGGNLWLDPGGKNFIGSDLYTGSYINGKKILDKGASGGDVWCNADATKWCYYGTDARGNAGHLVFSDGTDIPDAIHPVQIPLNGKRYMVWLYRMANGGNIDLLFCKKEL